MTRQEFKELFLMLSLWYGDEMAAVMIYSDMPNTAKKFLADFVLVDDLQALDILISNGMQPSQLKIVGE